MIATRTPRILAAALALSCATAYAEARLPPPPAQLDVSATLSAYDANGDGKLSRSEAGHWTLLHTAFKRLDRNRDGKLDRRELERAGVTPNPSSA